MQPSFYAVVPAGGAGTRLWPLSRQDHPKFLHDLTGTGRTLIQATADRLLPLSDGLVVVTGDKHADAVAAQLDLDVSDLLTEPSPRDSMAAIGLAAALLAHRHPDQDVILGSFAADHVITDTDAFARAVRTAVAAATEDYVVTIGIRATAPSTAFGYIRMGDPLASGVGAHHVHGFTEKPDAATAEEYLATGAYRWNAGMFVVRARVLLDHLARLQPTLAAGLERIAAAWDTSERTAVLDREWPALTKIAIDHAIAEPVAAAGGVAVVPGEFDWDDVGDWQSLGDLLPAGLGDVRVLGEESDVLALDSPGALAVTGSGRRLVLLGVPDAVVVDTADAVLVTTRDQAQRVKEIVARLSDDDGGLT
ncbi:mannose-1-phosphate guanylyltransferase [Ruania alba]|uniref:Mannose-1-phosphate guanylyltransferase (GDP) /mannose-6-phosphate isomerase, type 2 n=1 Tax=Ruania alba TaxID=648782 RepID=A0A1H5CM32_9MICO|nr:sugar phosphate nucleotidyltransferase [Ruania alba]SED67732.1 mannose-1-phosphate guanylyltransferase (GDP) /mannose-6-phosphate isomerase, type 2 [Ruania alba]